MKKLRIILLLLLNVIFTRQSFSQITEWVSQVISFSSELGRKQLSASQVVGKPSVMPDFGETPCGWTPKNYGPAKEEWIIVGFDSAIHVSQIAINATVNPEGIYKVILFDSNGTEHTVYKRSVQLSSSTEGKMVNFIIEKIKYRTNKLKLVLQTDIIYTTPQIDAIAISESSDSIKPRINYLPDKTFSNKPERLGPEINSKYHELAPVITQDGKRLYFVREGHPKNLGFMKMQDVWYSDIDSNGRFSESVNIGPPINNSYSNFVCSTTPDGNGLLLGNIYLRDGSMRDGVSMSYFDGTKWSFPDSLNIKNFYNNNRNVSFSMSSSGKVLLMSLERNDTYGGFDIYVSFLNNDSSWSEPKNIGPEVNTAGDEISPFLAADETTLYYSTNGETGFGSSDMFLSRRLDSTWTNWSEPENLGPEINTKGWDAYYSITASGDYAYFVSDSGLSTLSDIYRIKLPERVKPKSVALLSGKVLDSKTKEPVEATIKYQILSDGKEAGIAHSNAKTGDYKIVLPTGSNYGFLAEAEGFIAISEHLDLTKIGNYQEIVKNLYLVPIEKGQIVKLNNLFFDFGKSEILKESYPELNRVLRFLNEKPEIKILIEGHTDNVGSAKTNLQLSEKRAKAVADYLINMGIDRNRLSTKGYGNTKPVADNNTEDGRQQNRRVEFVILK